MLSLNDNNDNYKRSSKNTSVSCNNEDDKDGEKLRSSHSSSSSSFSSQQRLSSKKKRKSFDNKTSVIVSALNSHKSRCYYNESDDNNDDNNNCESRKKRKMPSGIDKSDGNGIQRPRTRGAIPQVSITPVINNNDRSTGKRSDRKQVPAPSPSQIGHEVRKLEPPATKNFINNLPYMGELTFDSRPRRGRKPKKADICHLITKNYGIQFPQDDSPSADNLLSTTTAPLESSSESPRLNSFSNNKMKQSFKFVLPAALPKIPLPNSSNKKRRKLGGISSPAGQFLLPPPDLVPISLLQDRFSSPPPVPLPVIGPPSFSPPTLTTLQKLYQEKYSIPSSNTSPATSSALLSLLKEQPLNLCTRDLVEDCYQDEDERIHGQEEEGDEIHVDILDNDSEFKKYSSFLVNDHFLYNNNEQGCDDERDKVLSHESESVEYDDDYLKVPMSMQRSKVASARDKKRSRTRHRRRAAGNNNNNIPLKHPQWIYHHLLSSPPNPASSTTNNKFSELPKSRRSATSTCSSSNANVTTNDNANTRRRKPPTKTTATSAIINSGGSCPAQPPPCSSSSVPSAMAAASNNAQVSICKFKFTGGVKPTLQEKKMLSLDSGGNFRFYSDKPLCPSSVSLASNANAEGNASLIAAQLGSPVVKGQLGRSSNQNTSQGHKKGCVSVGGNVTTTTSLLSLPKSAKSMSICMLPSGSSSTSAAAVVVPPSKPVQAGAGSQAQPQQLQLPSFILPDITISSCNEENENDGSGGPQSYTCSLPSSPQSPGSGSFSDSHSSSGLETDNESHAHVKANTSNNNNPSTSNTRRLEQTGRRKQRPAESDSSLSSRSRSNNNSINNRSRRATKKTVSRENLEKTFKEKGFLIQTQQLESSEGVTYCKFRQLKKFTRYLFRSWKDYLPENVKDAIVPQQASASGIPSTSSSGFTVSAYNSLGLNSNTTATITFAPKQEQEFRSKANENGSWCSGDDFEEGEDADADAEINVEDDGEQEEVAGNKKKGHKQSP